MFGRKTIVKSFVSFCLSITLSQIPLTTADALDSLESEYQETIETKFSTLQLSQFGYVGNQRVVIGAFQNQIAVAQSNTSRVEVFSLSNDQIVLDTSLELTEILDTKKGAGIYVLDIEYGIKGKLYVSYLDFFDDPTKCDYVKVIEFAKPTTPPRLIFQSTPCLSMLNFSQQQGSYTASGRMTLSKSTLYIAGGMVMIDLAHNIYPDPNIARLSGSFKKDLALSNLFGSVAKVDLKTLRVTKVSTGHRNPQGLVFDPKKNILWESEHGPSGGDELNIIKQGANYGWPYVTLGRPYYESDLLPENNLFKTRYSSHKGFSPPIYSWVPSIAPSQMVVVPDESSFDRTWGGNLLLSTLKDSAIHRLVLSDSNHVLYDERIEIGHRIRDLAITKSCLWISTDDGKIILIRPTKNFNN